MSVVPSLFGEILGRGVEFPGGDLIVGFSLLNGELVDDLCNAALALGVRRNQRVHGLEILTFSSPLDRSSEYSSSESIDAAGVAVRERFGADGPPTDGRS